MIKLTFCLVRQPGLTREVTKATGAGGVLEG